MMRSVATREMALTRLLKSLEAWWYQLILIEAVSREHIPSLIQFASSDWLIAAINGESELVDLRIEGWEGAVAELGWLSYILKLNSIFLRGFTRYQI